MVKLDLAAVCKLGLLGLVLTFCSCNKENAPDCFKTAGEVQTETRYLGSFTKLELNSNLKYELVDTNFCGIEITGPKNLLPKIYSLKHLSTKLRSNFFEMNIPILLKKHSKNLFQELEKL